MKVYLVRHGQSNYNALRLHNDDPSIGVFLTELGKEQAAALAKRLSDVPIDHIYMSELLRTHQTAEIINKNHNAPMTIDKRLNDNKSGFEGKPDQDYEYLLEKASNKWTERFNDGESLDDVKKRVTSFIKDLQKQNHKICVVVTSRVPAQFFNGYVRGLSNEEAWNVHIDKGSCIELEL